MNDAPTNTPTSDGAARPGPDGSDKVQQRADAVPGRADAVPGRADTVRQAALDFHALPVPGKLEVRPTKPLATPHDLSRAYSPGVAEACLEIARDPLLASRYTTRGNLVAVVSNGTAALGLGDIGPLASKPIMEGKAVLFKKFAHIDCFDIEIAETDPERLAEHVIALEPTFGAVNLEDIRAPDCFVVERICRERMGIPVFHDDQHGTAIVVGAAVTNALFLTERRFEDLKVVSTGGGAAGIACLDLLLSLGVARRNVWLFDRDGLVHRGREATQEKAAYAQGADMALGDAIEGADLFLGLSGPDVLSPDMVGRMAERPIIMALANPRPEIMPDAAREAAPDAIIATGRSDYPNQVNNVLCFPFIFRGALDVGATQINEAMKIACVDGIAQLARQTTQAETAQVYGDETLVFGRDYLIPKPFDPRLLAIVAGAVAEAAMETGVATRPIADMDAYRAGLDALQIKSSMVMRPVFESSRAASRRIVFAEGENEAVLRTAYVMAEETADVPILVGRPDVIRTRAARYGLAASVVDGFEVVNPESDARYRDYWTTYHEAMARRGVSPDLARAILRTNTTVIAAVMVRRGEADAMICGTFGNYGWHLNYVCQMLQTDKLAPIGALSLLLMDDDALFVGDPHVHPEPTPEELAAIVRATARHVRRFGLEPKVAICSNSQFGTLQTESAERMRAAMRILDAMAAEGRIDFEYEGEMPIDAALDPDFRARLFPGNRMTGKANALIFSSSETAGGVRNVLKTVGGGIEVGPILMGMGNRAHIVTPSTTVRGLINVAALAGTPVARYG